MLSMGRASHEAKANASEARRPCSHGSTGGEHEKGMPLRAEPKYRRISVRLSKADLELIDRAAHLLGQSRGAFVREAALRAAQRVLAEQPHAHPADVHAGEANETSAVENLSWLAELPECRAGLYERPISDLGQLDPTLRVVQAKQNLVHSAYTWRRGRPKRLNALMLQAGTAAALGASMSTKDITRRFVRITRPLRQNWLNQVRLSLRFAL